MNKKIIGIQEHLKWISKIQYHHTELLEKLKKQQHAYKRSVSTKNMSNFLNKEKQTENVSNHTNERVKEKEKEKFKEIRLNKKVNFRNIKIIIVRSHHIQ